MLLLLSTFLLLFRHLHHLGTIQCPVTWISMVRSPVDWIVSRFRWLNKIFLFYQNSKWLFRKCFSPSQIWPEALVLIPTVLRAVGNGDCVGANGGGVEDQRLEWLHSGCWSWVPPKEGQGDIDTVFTATQACQRLGTCQWPTCVGRRASAGRWGARRRWWRPRGMWRRLTLSSGLSSSWMPRWQFSKKDFHTSSKGLAISTMAN